VPTWNSAAVHAYGQLEVYDDVDWLRGLVTRLTEVHEAQFDQPWQVADAPADYIEGLLKGLSGLSCESTGWKVSGRWDRIGPRSIVQER